MYQFMYCESRASSTDKPVPACMDVALTQTSITISFLRQVKISFKIARNIKV